MPNEPHGKCDPHGRAPASILEELAGAVMSTDASDGAGVDRLLALLDELTATQDPIAGKPAAEAAARVRSNGADVRALAAALDAASEEVARMQEALARAARPQPTDARQEPTATADPGALVLSDWGDEKVLREFLAAQRGSLEDLEKEILAMEGGDPERRGAFKRRLHTMKGEAGVLGLDDLERVCHATEDFIETSGVSADVTDRLLKVRDWMAKAADGYSRLRLPQPSAAEFVTAVLAERPAAEPSGATSAQPASPSPTPNLTPSPTPSPTPNPTPTFFRKSFGGVPPAKIHT